MMRLLRKILKAIIIAVVSFVALIVVALVLMQPRTYKYTLKNPASLSERAAMLAKLEQELAGWQAMSKDGISHTAANDADRLWPLDRVTIVVALQRFTTDNKRLPSDLRELDDTGYLTSSTLLQRYRLTTSGGNWTLQSQRGYKMAQGN